MARRSKRPDPTVAPVMRTFATKEIVLRPRFHPSGYHTERKEKAAKARELNRQGVHGVKAGDIVVVK